MLKQISLLLWLVVIACSGGKTIIRSDPPTAFVFIDGAPKGVTPLEVKLDCDKDKKFEIKITSPGYKSQSKTISCDRLLGTGKNIFFKLEPGDEGGNQEIIKPEISFISPEERSFGVINIKSIPSEAEVYLNEKLLGTTPLIGKKIQCGDYQLKVTKSGFKPWVKKVQISSGSQQEYSPILEEE